MINRTRTLPDVPKKSSYDLLRERLRIDQNDLDNELIEHPVLLEKVALAHVLSTSTRDGQKEYLSHIQGRLSDNARATLEASGKKATVGQVDNALAEDPEWQAERSKFLELCKDSDRWFALKEAFQARGYALHNIAQIYVARTKAEGGVYERDMQ